jgi:hypothetical protein
LGDALAEAKPRDPIGLLIAQSRVAAALFGTQGVSELGRFQLLDRLGTGGMGVIYGAYDPQLERAVAVKIVHVPGPGGSGALAEAKALARLSHPNVVTIFDYGFIDEHLYIVMELVVGQTLKRWVKGRTQREILKAYRQAGEALAAAHAVALVHRDFKPDNAIMGADGRVRVVDFGLACETADPDRAPREPQRPAGTPGYMAPEQVSGAPVTAAADQYGFCTALRDALRDKGDRPGAAGIPRWLQTVIDRGRSPDPADRFPSMRELVQVLSRDPAAIKRRWLVGGALFAVGAAAAGVTSAASDARGRACDAGEARLATIWGASGREAALDRVAKMGPPGGALRPRLQADLADHARRWTSGYRDACLAGVRSIQSASLVDRRMACLERGRAALNSVAQIINTAEPGDAQGLILAVRALPDPDACSDLTALLSDAEPLPIGIAPRVAELRGRIEEARVQIAAGRSKQAMSVMEGTVNAARALSYKPVLSESLMVQGHAMMSAQERVAAIAPLTESFTTAFESGLSSLAVEAWARRAWTRGTSLGGEDSLAGLDVVEAIAANRSTSGFARALLYNNVGSVQLAMEKRNLARAAFERASREARGLTGPGAAELLNVNMNLGLTIDDPVRRGEILAASAAEKARLLGDDHPVTLDARWHLGEGTVRFDRALEILTPACTGLQAHDDARAVRCWLEVGYIRRELDDDGGAVAALQHAAAVAGHDSRSVLVPSYLLLWQGDVGGASRAFTNALDELPATDDQPWWDRFERADLELGFGRLLRASGHLQHAKVVLGSSLDRFCAALRKSSLLIADRRLGRARAELAQVLFALHESPATASALAGSAAIWLRQAGGSEAEVRQLDRITATRSPPADPGCSSHPLPVDSR